VIVETLVGLRLVARRIKVLFSPSMHSLHDQLVHRAEVPVLDFFLHESPGFRLELHGHTSNLAVCGVRRRPTV